MPPSSLTLWAWLLERNRPQTLRQRAFSLVTATKRSQLVVLMVVTLHTFGAVQASTVPEASASVSFGTGFYACLAAQTVFRVRGKRLRELVCGTADIVEVVQNDASSKQAQACLAEAKRADILMTGQFLVSGAFLVLGISITVLANGHYYGTVWPKPPGVWGDWIVVLLQVGSASFGSTTYYIFLSLISCVVIWITGSYRALAVEFESACSKVEVMRLVRIHQRLNDHARAFEYFLADVFMHLFLCCFSCPLTSTMDVLRNDITVNTFTVAAPLVFVFLPFSLMSQDLSDASMSIGFAAYHAMFQSVGRSKSDDLFVRRALLLTVASSRHPARLSLRGLGPLSLAAAGNALRTWYNLFNMVLSSSNSIRGA